MCPDDTSGEDERHSRHHHHTIVDIAVLVAPVRNNLETEDASGAEELSHESNHSEYPCIAKTIAKTIHKRVPRAVRHSIRPQSSHQDTVGNNQADIHR